MDLLEIAKELGEMLSKTDEMKEYSDSEAIINTDQKSIDLINDIEDIRKEFIRKSQNNASEEELDDLREKYMKMQQDYETYPPTARFVMAKANFDTLMQKVNNTIIYGMTGEMPCSDEKCASCSGGCSK